MLTLETKFHVEGLAPGDVYDFLAEPNDLAYQRWWPGTHLHLHRLDDELIYMDEYVGRRRLRMRGIVTEAVPGKRLTWQMKQPVRLPARFTLVLEGDETGVEITHTVEVGYGGFGRVLDPLLRLYVTPTFAKDLDQHVRREFPMFRDRLPEIRAAGDGPAPASAEQGERAHRAGR